MPETLKEEPQNDFKNDDVKIEKTVDTISSLFDERDRPKSEEKESLRVPETLESKKDKDPKAGESSPSKGDVKTVKKEDEDDDSSPELETLRGELEKTRKTLSENQKYGRQNAQKIKNLQKAVQEMEVEGVLTKTESDRLLEILQLEEESDEADYYKGSPHPFAPIFKTANKELENIRKYTDDALLQEKINAFDYFLSVASPDEIKEALEELTGLMDDPIRLTKKMLAIGQKAYEESYKEIQSAGGFKNYLLKKNQEIDRLQKKIDKLEKKLSHYEDFDKPRYRIDEMGDSEEGTPVRDTITALFEERDNVKRR